MSQILQLRNPLDAFATYSTHFVVLASRTTETARAFLGSANNKATLDAIEKVDRLGEPVPMGSAPGGGDAYLVMDTRRFSQFTVESMKYDVLVNGLANGEAHSNLATTIEMTILDSVGISFINFLQWLMDEKLKTNFDGMIFLIRVIFVGHNQDGSTETVQSLTIPATLFNLEVNLDHLKGIYNAVFMPNMNFSVFQHKRWLQIGQATSFYSNGSKTLGGVVRSFEERLNGHSAKMYKSSLEILRSTGASVPAEGRYGRLVRYQITLPEGNSSDTNWYNFEFLGSWKHNVNSSVERNFVDELKKLEAARTPQQQRESKPTDGTTSPGKDVHMSTDVGVTVTEVLDLMFKQVPRIAEFANADTVKKQDGVAKFYKHVVSLTSSEDVVIVHIDVVPFVVPKARPDEKKTTSDAQDHRVARWAAAAKEKNSPYTNVTDAQGITKRVPKNYFELDYTFTGKNTQVLNFDMKIQHLQFLLAANVRVSEGEMVFEKIAGGTDGKTNRQRTGPELLSMRPYDPILIPMATELQKSNFTAVAAAQRDVEKTRQLTSNLQEYARNLSAFYAISPIQTAITIKGNPDIMLKFSTPELPPHVSFATNTSATQTSASSDTARGQYRQEFEQRVLTLNRGGVTRASDGTFGLNNQLGPDAYVTSPVFAKINIKGPNVDFRTNQMIEGQDFASEILLDNYYVVFRVTNIIERGVFSQQLELWSHNVFGTGKISPETGKQQPQEVR